MKKLLLILLSIIMCVSVFASCDTETDNSSDVSVSSDNESSVEEQTSSEVSSESTDVSEISAEDISESNDQSSKEPSEDVSDDLSEDVSDVSKEHEGTVLSFEKAKVIYNPFEEHCPVSDNHFTELREGEHIGLLKHIKNNDISDDVWFCVCFTAGWETSGEEYLAMDSYLDEIGVVRDDELSKSFRHTVGYITKDIFEKMLEDNKPIEYAWLPKKCVDNGSHSSK